jgi:hypothetical protein
MTSTLKLAALRYSAQHFHVSVMRVRSWFTVLKAGLQNCPFGRHFNFDGGKGIDSNIEK